MRILLVEDDARLRTALLDDLRAAGFAADGAADGTEGEFLGQTETYDAVVLDLGLPGLDGISVLERWRRAGRTMPVLILTAREEWSEKVRGFRAGADDYLTKPFRTEEVIIRLRSLIRRAAGHATTVLDCGPLSLDTQMGLITLDGLPIRLTAFEQRLLAFLIHHTGRIVTRTELSEHLYERDTDAISIPSKSSSAGCAARSGAAISRPSAARAIASCPSPRPVRETRLARAAAGAAGHRRQRDCPCACRHPHCRAPAPVRRRDL